VLPVSGITLHIREATGADELIVLEPAGTPVATVLTLASRLATGAAGQLPAWDELPAADVGAIALTHISPITAPGDTAASVPAWMPAGSR
jgi:hypothetical protein